MNLAQPLFLEDESEYQWMNGKRLYGRGPVLDVNITSCVFDFPKGKGVIRWKFPADMSMYAQDITESGQ